MASWGWTGQDEELQVSTRYYSTVIQDYTGTCAGSCVVGMSLVVEWFIRLPNPGLLGPSLHEPPKRTGPGSILITVVCS